MFGIGMADFLPLLTGAGSLLKSGAGFLSHSGAAQSASANARMLSLQAEIAAEKGDLALTRGAYDQFLQRRKVGAVLAGQTAQAAGGNVDPGYGSPLMLQGFSAAQGEVDAALIHAAALSERADALTGAANLEGRAAGESSRAQAESTAGWLELALAPINAGTAFLQTSRLWAGLNTAPSRGGMIGGVGFDPSNVFGGLR